MIVTPSTINSYQKQVFPEIASEIINSLIASKWNGYSASFFYKEFVTLLKATNIVENSIEYNLSLNFMNIYSDAGWDIETEYNCDNERYYFFTEKLKND